MAISYKITKLILRTCPVWKFQKYCRSCVKQTLACV